MNIPDKVRIGSCNYEVKLSDEVLLIDHKECSGLIDFRFHIIKINDSLVDKQCQEKTFLHEVVHGIIEERQLDLANSDEETIVDEIARGLHQVIRDNPNIFKSSIQEVEE